MEDGDVAAECGGSGSTRRWMLRLNRLMRRRERGEDKGIHIGFYFVALTEMCILRMFCLVHQRWTGY